MYRKVKLLLCLGLAYGIQSAQAQNPNRQYQRHTWQNDKLTIQTNDGIIEIVPFSDKIAAVSFKPIGKVQPDTSHAVILRPAKNIAKLKAKGNLIDLKTKNIAVQIQKSPFQIQFTYLNQVITSEGVGFFANDSLTGFKFNLTEAEALYGSGERALPLDRRGNRLELYNRPHYGYETESKLMGYNIPLVLSSKKYAVFFDNASKGFIDLGKTASNTLSFESTGGKMTYYVVAGADFYEILQAYTELTGRQPMPPRWAFGNFASRYGYRTEAQTRQVIEEFIKQDIPVSAVVLDHYWYGEGEIKKSVGMGNLDWHRPAFPTSEQMVKDFQQKGVETVLISQPFVLTNSTNYTEVKSNRLLATDKAGEAMVIPYFYFGETGLLDIFKPDTQRWYWSKYKNLINQGVNGVWGDLGEPEVHPDDMMHTAGKATDVHNIYGHYWAKTVYEGYKRDFPAKRPFILMRAGFAGSQRFGLIPWSGDVSHSWGGFQVQPALALNMGLCGLGYMHSDLGGFAGGTKDDELYIRWLQYGLFQPIFRPHAQEQVPAEPIYYEEPTKSIVRDIIKLRYKLMPYNYTLAYQNATKGYPMMRPLFFAEPDNADLKNLSDTYLWGDNILVAPVLNAKQTQRKVYLPRAVGWYNFFTGQRYDGGQWITVNVSSLTEFPVFVRAGAFIPMRSEGKLELHYFTDRSAAPNQGEMYEDDGSTPLTSEAPFSGFRFESKKSRGNFNLIIKPINQKQRDKIALKIHGLLTMPTDFTVNGKKLNIIQPMEARTGDGYWNPSTRELSVELDRNEMQDLIISWK
jgi:alpha-glucosidase (family GH31 glycosyl hydrolase)